MLLTLQLCGALIVHILFCSLYRFRIANCILYSYFKCKNL